MLVLCTLFAAVHAVTTLYDGQTFEDYIESGSNSYSYVLSEYFSDQDLFVGLTIYSDTAPPTLSASISDKSSWQSDGNPFLVIPRTFLDEGDLIFIDVDCPDQCDFLLSLAYSLPIEVPVGKEVAVPVPQKFQVTSDFIIKSPGAFSVEVTDSTGSSISPVELWDGSLEFHLSGGSAQATVSAPQPTMAVVRSQNTTNWLRKASQTTGSVQHESYQLYSTEINDADADLSIELVLFSGNATVFVSFDGAADASHHSFKLSGFRPQALVITSQDRDRYDAGAGEVSLAVYGEESANYLLTVTEAYSARVELSPGLSHTGIAEYQAFKYFSLPLQNCDASYEISVHLTPRSGHSAIYVKLCEGLCSFTAEEIDFPESNGVLGSKHNHGPESLLFTYVGRAGSSVCNYLIGVRGESLEPANFLLVATLDTTTEYVLREGFPLAMTIPPESYLYYRFTVSDPLVFSLTAMLSIVAGDAEMYMGKGYVPSQTEYSAKTAESLTEIPRLTITEDVIGTYHLAVYSNSSATVAVLIQEQRHTRDSIVELYPGFPIIDTIFNLTEHNQKLFYFPIDFTNSDSESIRIIVSPFTGSYNLYVTNAPDFIDWGSHTFLFRWKDEEFSEEIENVITLAPDQSEYSPKAEIVSAVVAHDFTRSGTATYSIHYELNDGTVTLTEDIPVTGTVPGQQYRYYAFPIQERHKNLKVSLSPISGDPDLYVSLSNSNTRPTSSNFDIATDHVGSDVLTVTWSGQIEKHCGGLLDEYHHGDPIHCMLYIGVYGSGDSIFKLKVHTLSLEPEYIVLGDTQQGFMNLSDYQYYYTEISTGDEAKINVASLSGDSDLYVNLFDSETSDPKDWELPGKENSMHSSTKSGPFDSVGMPPSWLNLHCPSGSCIAVIAVFCFNSPTCKYSLQATQGPVVLQEGQAAHEYVEKMTFNYYTFYCSQETNNLVIDLNILAGEDPSLYVSKGRDNLPTLGHYDWKSETSWDEEIVIRPDELYSMLNQTMVGTFQIGVFSIDGASEYTLVVNNNDVLVRPLLNGIASHGRAPANSVRYYKYLNTRQSDVVISLTPYVGQTNMTVAYYTPELYPDESEDSFLPTKTVYIWSSQQSSDQNEIRIPQDDLNFCTHCYFLIGVFMDAQNCSYSLTVTNQLSYQVLTDGLPTAGSVEEQGSRYYAFKVNEVSDIDIILNAYSGDPDITVTTDKTLTTTMWSSSTSSKIDHIQIHTTDEWFDLGEYFITVSGYTSASFSILAHLHNSPMHLIDGWPTVDSLNPDNTDYSLFEFDSAGQGDYIYCSLTPLSPLFRPLVYVKLAHPADPSDFPSIDNNDLSFSPEDYNQLYGTLNFEVAPTPDKRNLRMGVYSFFPETPEAETLLPGEYELECSSSTQINKIKPSTHGDWTIPAGQTLRRFRVDLSEQGYFEVDVVPCSAKLEVMVSEHWTELKDSGDKFKVSTLTGGALRAIIQHAQVSTYYITVAKVIKENVTEEVHFGMQSSFHHDSSEVPPRLTAGHEGTLTVVEEAESVSVSWSPVEYENGEEFTGLVKYSVVVSAETETNFVTSCGISTALTEHFADVVGTSWNATHLSFKSTLDHSGIINVMAETEQGEKVYVTYSPIIVQFNSDFAPTGIMYLVFFGLAALLVLVVVVTIVIYCRCKKIERELIDENQDVRRLAAGVELGEFNRQGFGALSAQEFR